VWIRSVDITNSNLMILLSYIILGHPDWHKGAIKIFDVCKKEEVEKTKEGLVNLIKEGRLPISQKNVEIIEADINVNVKNIITERSADAGLTLIGFRAERLKHDGVDMFGGFDTMGDILFVNSHRQKEIT